MEFPPSSNATSYQPIIRRFLRALPEKASLPDGVTNQVTRIPERSSWR